MVKTGGPSRTENVKIGKNLEHGGNIISVEAEQSVLTVVCYVS